MESVGKRPPGPVPRGAIWLEKERRYHYTKEYFDIREQALKKSRINSYQKQKARMDRLREARPHLWQKKQKSVGTLDAFMKKSNGPSARAGGNLSESEFSECPSLPEGPQTKGDTSSAKGCGGICEQSVGETNSSSSTCV